MYPDPCNDMFHLLTILESMGKLDHYLNSINSAEDFINKEDQLYFNASLTLLTNIGEVFGKLSTLSQNFFQKEDLIGVRGIRNRIVHDYTGIDSFRIYEIIKTNLPDLQRQVILIFKKHLSDSIFNETEYEIAKNSTFYKHINFKLIK